MPNRAMSPGFWPAALFVALTVAAPLHGQDTKKQVTLPAGASPQFDIPRVEYTRFVMPNGLTVILHEDHSSPLIALHVAYHVGSKDEPVGKRGIAHFFEHAMFGGSKQVQPEEHIKIVQGAGGSFQAGTREDRTSFYETGPSNMLETFLWLEADRMSSMLDRLDSAKFELQRAEITNEYALNYLAAPTVGGQFPWAAQFALTSTLFPEGDPYHLPPIGNITEFSTVSLADARAFFNKYYVPNNATVVVTGDFATRDARALVQKYFGAIPRGAPVTHPKSVAPPLPEVTRVVLQDRVVQTRQLWMAWRGASSRSPDRMALIALGDILASGPASRLGRALISERKLAAAMGPLNGHVDLEGVGTLHVSIVPAPKVTLTAVESAADSVIAQVKSTGVTAEELRRWVARFSVSSLITQQRNDAVADLLEDGQMMYDDPLMELSDAGRAQKLTTADLLRVAKQYLGKGHVVMSIVPADSLSQVSKPELPYTNIVLPRRP